MIKHISARLFFSLPILLVPQTISSTFQCYSSFDFTKNAIMLHEIHNTNVQTIWQRLKQFELKNCQTKNNPKPFYPGYFTCFGIGNKKGFAAIATTNQLNQATLSNFISSGNNLTEFLTSFIAYEQAKNTPYSNVTSLSTYVTKQSIKEEKSSEAAGSNWTKNHGTYNQEIENLKSTIKIAEKQLKDNKKIIAENERQFNRLTNPLVRCNYLNEFCKLLVGQGFKKQLVYTALLSTGFWFGTCHLLENNLWKIECSRNFFKNPWSLAVPLVGWCTAKAWYKLMAADYYTPTQS